MSLIGKTPIKVPDGVTITLEGRTVTVKGPKGELSEKIHPAVTVKQEDGIVTVTRRSDDKFDRSIHGTTQRLIENMVAGVTEGYVKNLELVGTGYRVAKQGSKIVLSLGYSHPVEYQAPAGIEITTEGNNKITVKGISKQIVGQVAATIREFRRPEPYKGKGIRYENEVIRRKAGKAAKAA